MYQSQDYVPTNSGTRAVTLAIYFSRFPGSILTLISWQSITYALTDYATSEYQIRILRTLHWWQPDPGRRLSDCHHITYRLSTLGSGGWIRTNVSEFMRLGG
jgi:hypothetical protein